MSGALEFSRKKEALKSKLRSCLKVIKELRSSLKDSELSSYLESYEEKLRRALETADSSKLKIALFGSFSDGKSTILSAITGNLGIKIAPEPTTDKVNYYNFKDYYIIDTPGLFSENIPHDDETKRFISEADLIIFTTDAVNPLKESQHGVIRWILKDLGKLPQTVFVINKMDAVTDVYDEETFKNTCRIKKKTVRDTLNKILQKNRNDYIIICLSADPWAMGLEYWLQNEEEYRKISRIGELEEVISKVAREKGNELRRKTLESVLSDVSASTYGRLEKEINNYEKNLKLLEVDYKELEGQVRFAEEMFLDAHLETKKRLLAMRKRIIGDIQACEDYNCLDSLITSEIGKDGKVLLNKISVVIEEELKPLMKFLSESVGILERINKDLQGIRASSKALGEIAPLFKVAGSFLSETPTGNLRDLVLKTRDFLNLPVKFRPWGAFRLAENLKGVGLALKGVSVGIKVYARKRFEKDRNELVDHVGKLIDSLLDEIDKPEEFKKFVPLFLNWEKEKKDLKEKLDFHRKRLGEFKTLKEALSKCGGEV